MSFFGPDIKLLQNLLKTEESDGSDIEDDRLPAAGLHKIGPGQIANPSTKNLQAPPAIKLEAEKTPKTIEEWEEMQANETYCIAWDNRKTPEYKIIYNQNVGTEDVFLQMGNKTCLTSSCENMMLEIYLPNEKSSIDRMKLSVASTEINLETVLYKLKLSLPYKIDPDKGNAAYDTDKEILKLTLKMEREFDYVNF